MRNCGLVPSTAGKFNLSLYFREGRWRDQTHSTHRIFILWSIWKCGFYPSAFCYCQHLSEEHVLFTMKEKKWPPWVFLMSTLNCFFCKSDGISCFSLPGNLISSTPLDPHSSSCHGRCINVEYLAAFLNWLVQVSGSRRLIEIKQLIELLDLFLLQTYPYYVTVATIFQFLLQSVLRGNAPWIIDVLLCTLPLSDEYNTGML